MQIGLSTWGYFTCAQQSDSQVSTAIVLPEVAAMGFKGIEVGWPLSELPSVSEFRAQLDQHGLCAVGHWVEVTFHSQCLDEAEQKARFLQNVGGMVLICEGEKQAVSMTRDQYLALYRQFDAIGRICEKYDIRAAFHFHRGCLETEEEVHDFFSHTKSVWFCPDIGHASAAGWNPIPVMQQYRDKIVHVHLKDARMDSESRRFSRFVELGKGNNGLDIRACLDCLNEMGFQGWAMIEQDHTTISPADDAAESRRFLQRIGHWTP
ncbi:MAG: sugar phosphate isomerase/epimerase family protein [Acidobacteriota bacterium]